MVSAGGAAQNFFARSAALRPSSQKTGLPGAAAREPAAQGQLRTPRLYFSNVIIQFSKIFC